MDSDPMRTKKPHVEAIWNSSVDSNQEVGVSWLSLHENPETDMHRSERTIYVACADCGTELNPGGERSFAFGERGMLCFDCAFRRGGRYGEVFDRWHQEPLIDDLGPMYD